MYTIDVFYSGVWGLMVVDGAMLNKSGEILHLHRSPIYFASTREVVSPESILKRKVSFHTMRETNSSKE